MSNPFDPKQAQIGEILDHYPEFAGLWNKARAIPETPEPPPSICPECRDEVPWIASMGAWKRGFCARCERARVKEEAHPALKRIVERRVKRDAGEDFADFVKAPRRKLNPLIKQWAVAGMDMGAWLCLYGPPGTGKTTQAIELLWAIHGLCALAVEVEEDWQLGALDTLMRNRVVQLVTEQGLARSTWPNASNRRSVEHWCTVPTLIIDEVGRRERATDNTLEVLSTVYDERWRRRLPTVFISNYHPLTELPGRNDTWGDETIHSRFIQRLGGPTLPAAISFEDQVNYRATEEVTPWWEVGKR